MVAPISDLLRDPRFREQNKAFNALFEALKALISRWYCGPTLIRDVRDYFLWYGYRRRKRSASQRVAMLPAKFLRPGEVLELDIEDMGVKSDAGNKVLLVAVDNASKFLFASPLPTKDTLGVARNCSN